MRDLKRLPILVLAVALAALVVALVLLQGGSADPYPLVPLGQALIASVAALAASETSAAASRSLSRPTARSPPISL